MSRGWLSGCLVGLLAGGAGCSLVLPEPFEFTAEEDPDMMIEDAGPPRPDFAIAPPVDLGNVFDMPPPLPPRDMSPPPADMTPPDDMALEPEPAEDMLLEPEAQPDMAGDGGLDDLGMAPDDLGVGPDGALDMAPEPVDGGMAPERR